MTTAKFWAAGHRRNLGSTVDIVFGWLMVASALLHAAGSFTAYEAVPETLLWALSATAGELLLAGINLLRASRIDDTALARLSFAGCLAWIAIVLRFGSIIGNVLDVRVLVQGSITLVLAGMSLRSAGVLKGPASAAL